MTIMKMNDIKINQHERIDDLHRKGYRIIQNPDSFCFGQDAVLLSGFAKAYPGDKVLDLCSGNAIVPILLCGRFENIRCVGVEIQKESYDLGIRSVRLNGLDDIISLLNMDINKLSNQISYDFDAITVNPPYMNDGGGFKNPHLPKAIARHEIACTLDDVIRVSAARLKWGGRFYMIHRPKRLTDIFVTMRNRGIEPKKLQLVYPKEGKEPTMALIEGIRGAKPMLNVLPPLVVYDENNRYTKEVYSIYYE